jgi:hypothetical protein
LRRFLSCLRDVAVNIFFQHSSIFAAAINVFDLDIVLFDEMSHGRCRQSFVVVLRPAQRALDFLPLRAPSFLWWGLVLRCFLLWNICFLTARIRDKCLIFWRDVTLNIDVQQWLDEIQREYRQNKVSCRFTFPTRAMSSAS